MPPENYIKPRNEYRRLEQFIAYYTDLYTGIKREIIVPSEIMPHQAPIIDNHQSGINS